MQEGEKIIILVFFILPLFLMGQNSSIKDTVSINSYKHEITIGTPMFPTYFYNYGIGMKDQYGGRILGATLMLNKMESNHSFFPPVNISYRKTINEKKKKKLQIGGTFYQVPIYYSEAKSFVKVPVSYLFLNGGIQRKINKSKNVDLCWGYDFLFGYVNPQGYGDGTQTIKNLHTVMFGSDIGLSVIFHVSKRWFVQIEQYISIDILINDGDNTPLRTNTSTNTVLVDLIFPKLLGVNAGYKF